ncbi:MULTISPECIES: GDSL-type esterase/lipase family protein [Methylobacteriaceae]|uniref:SGNH/GDSL hydrolase family protein n=1 Tax=Methylobacteriaceae TaxID=119045 RepID=UPI000762DED4|nr:MULTISPECIES: GDSL-type esterase/lipase family protein [Methylobacteriaceae]TFZ55668.1 SGNH/GDSL hydrolase family protein [Methylorubrum sp. Q1]
MAFPQTAADAQGTRRRLARRLAVLLGLSLASPAFGETSGAAPMPAAPSTATVEALDLSLSPECRVPGSKLYTLARLKAVKAALKEKRPIHVLSIGSSSAGLGASASYPVKLENALEQALPDVQVEVEARGLPGEVASGAGERLRSMVAEMEPDLVVWQVGTNDALARVDIEAFGEALDESVQWVKSHGIDIVLIDPVFTESLADDAYYTQMVRTVQDVARREAVPLVHRYAAMRFLSTQRTTEAHMLGRHFRLNDLGLRCMAEHATRAITLSLLQPDAAKDAAKDAGKIDPNKTDAVKADHATSETTKPDPAQTGTPGSGPSPAPKQP